MSMDLGGHGGPKSEINVTPLVDVVLVLLIIFMVVQPLLQRGYEVQVPPNAPPQQPNTPPPTDQIIVSLTANREYPEQGKGGAREHRGPPPGSPPQPELEGGLLLG